MVTTREAASTVRLNTDWQEKYRSRAQTLLESTSAGTNSFCVCIVGRAGVGKGSLINHLLRQRAARVAHNESNALDEERKFDIYGFRVREIPGYDGKHSIGSKSKHRWRSSHGKSSHDSSGSNEGRMELEDFVKAYRLFEEETNAIIFVVGNRITQEDQKLMSLAIESRKFFCVVRTHADSIVRIADCRLQKERLEELEEEIRRSLSMSTNVNVRIFIVSIPWPEGRPVGLELEGADLEEVLKNSQFLHFPLLQSFLSEPKGLCDEIQIHGFVKEEVWKILGPFQTVKKRYQALDFAEHLVAGTLLPIAGPVMLTFTKTLYYTLKACSEVGLIEDADDAIQKVNTETNKAVLVAHIASKEGLVTAVHDSFIHIFGKVVFELAMKEVVSTAAEATISGAMPVVGPMISAVHLPSRFRKIADKLAVKACMLHELWIMQNITGLLGKT